MVKERDEEPPTGGEKMHFDQTAMCPKHGIAHGVCVDPIKTTGGSTTSEPGYVEPSGTGETSAASCTLCGQTGITFPHTCNVEKPLQLSEFCPTCHKAWVSGSLISENRFEPFEALDTILQCASAIEAAEEIGHAAGDVATLHNQVYALRAYITGMGK